MIPKRDKRTIITHLSIEIPEDVIAHLRLPSRDLKQELKKELAVHLYAEGLLPEASACRLADMTRLPFARLLGARQIPIRYTAEDLDQDLQTLRELK